MTPKYNAPPAATGGWYRGWAFGSVMAQRTNDGQRWQAGDHVLLRYRRNQPADVVQPVTVVEDSVARTILYTSVGTTIKVPFTTEGEPIGRDIPFAERARMPFFLGDRTWHSANLLAIVDAGRASGIGLFWDAVDWRFIGYYANLQAPLTRTPLGFDSADYLLDIVIEPDLTWRWKDEDEFAIAQEIGIFTAEQAEGIRAEGKRVIADVEARRSPFDGSFERWRPDPSWTLPTIPADWDRDWARSDDR